MVIACNSLHSYLGLHPLAIVAHVEWYQVYIYFTLRIFQNKFHWVISIRKQNVSCLILLNQTELEIAEIVDSYLYLLIPIELGKSVQIVWRLTLLNQT